MQIYNSNNQPAFVRPSECSYAWSFYVNSRDFSNQSTGHLSVRAIQMHTPRDSLLGLV